MKARSVLLAGCVGLAACTSQPHVALENPAGSTAVDGSMSVAAAETRLAAYASPLPSILVTVTNSSANDEAFGPANVAITANGRPLRPFAAADLTRQIRRRFEFQQYAAETRADIEARTLERDPVPLTNRTAIETRANGLQESAAASWAERRDLEALGDVLTPTVLKPGETITRRVVLHSEDLRSASVIEVHIQLGNASGAFTLRVST